jgi:hypothetical protein
MMLRSGQLRNYELRWNYGDRNYGDRCELHPLSETLKRVTVQFTRALSGG